MPPTPTWTTSSNDDKRKCRKGAGSFYEYKKNESDPFSPILKTGKAKAIRFSTLEAICAALECQPGDLLAFNPTVPAEE